MAYNNNNNSKNTMQTSDYLNSNLSYYLSVNVNNICRICLEKGNKLMPIFDPIKPPHFSILIMACASVQVVEGDGLPSHICQKCISKLNLAFQFKSQCESADSKLRQCLQLQSPQQHQDISYIEIKDSTGEPVNIIFNEVSTAQEPIEGIEVSNVTESEALETVQVQLQCDDQLQEPQLEPLQTVPLESLQSIATIETDLKIEYLKQQEPQIKTNEIALVLSEPKAKVVTKDHKCHLCGKGFSKKNGLIHHIRIHTGERPYVCRICDKRFINGGHLHIHMRTHTGEKKHVCAACSKAFATAQQLTKHTIAIHTSERPYPCTYCPKRFASSSNLNTHIKIHTGEKNYYCDQCGKAFSTKGQLYQHMLVHTGEKAFLCEYCNRRFSQKAHLIRHLKMHKN